MRQNCQRFVLASLWLLAADLFESVEKRLAASAFSKIGAATLAGGMFGGLIAKALSGNVDPQWPHDTSDAMVTDFCRALDESKERIPWAHEAPLPLAQMVRDTPEGHLDVPLHPAAERFWRQCGYLP